jgi:hypothetical protein
VQELGQIKTTTCSTHPGNARARPRRSARAHSPAPCQPHARARGYKAHLGLDRTPPRVPDSARARVRRRLPREPRASGRTSHDHRRPVKLAILRLVQPLGLLLWTPVKLPEPRIEQYLIGDAGSTSPDFNRPLSHVDRAPRYAICRFLVPIASMASREAPCAI